MDCPICGGATNQRDGERRDLGGDRESVVCPDCLDVADEIADSSGPTGTESGIGADSTIGSYSSDSALGGDSTECGDSEPASDSSDSGVTVKYAM